MRPETDDELRARIARLAAAVGTRGKFMELVYNATGKDLDLLAARVNLKRRKIER